MAVRSTTLYEVQRTQRNDTSIVIVIPLQLTPHNATVAEERQDFNEIAGSTS